MLHVDITKQLGEFSLAASFASEGRVTGLFRLTFDSDAPVSDKLKGEPIYLIMAMSDNKLIRLKPQNLVTGLPIKHLEALT